MRHSFFILVILFIALSSCEKKYSDDWFSADWPRRGTEYMQTLMNEKRLNCSTSSGSNLSQQKLRSMQINWWSECQDSIELRQQIYSPGVVVGVYRCEMPSSVLGVESSVNKTITGEASVIVLQSIEVSERLGIHEVRLDCRTSYFWTEDHHPLGFSVNTPVLSEDDLRIEEMN